MTDPSAMPPGSQGALPPGPLSPEEALARDAVRALPPVAPDPAFRARLKDDFAGVPVAARRPGRARAGRALAWATFAAVLVAGVVAVAVINPGERWQVATTQDATGNVLVDGDPVPVSDVASLGDLLHPGAEIEWRGQGDLELLSAGQVALAIMPGTVMTLPEPPRRLFARTTRGTVVEGEIRLTTGPGMRGAGLVFTTPEAEVSISGTTLAVIREPTGTCVCVYEGHVRIRAGGHDMGAIPPGLRQLVFNDGRTPERSEIRPMEKTKLGMMRDAMRPVLEPGKR